MAEEVSHSGIVKEITPEGKIKISIVSKANCISCQLNGVCSASDVKEKIVEVDHYGGVLKIGETVNVALAENTGFKAMFLGYLLPFLILFTTLIVLTELKFDELTAGLLSLATLVPYYFTLYIFKNKIKKNFSFFVRK